MKQCSKCGQWKDKSEFNNDRTKLDGLRPDCKDCRRPFNTIEHRVEFDPTYREKNNDRSNLYHRQHPEKIDISKKRAYQVSPEYKAKRNQRTEKNKKNRNAAFFAKTKRESDYYQRCRLSKLAPANSEKRRVYQQTNQARIKRNHREKYYKDIKSNGYISKTLRIRLYMALQAAGAKKTQGMTSLIGCSIPELRRHLESQFKVGMTWDNWTFNGWHIDHIKPCAAFNLSDPEEQKRCFHFSNLQPLWAMENFKKNDTYMTEE